MTKKKAVAAATKKNAVAAPAKKNAVAAPAKPKRKRAMDPSNLQPVEDDPTPAAKKTKPQAASRKQKGIRATEHDIAEGRQRTLQPGPQAAAGSSSSSGPPATCVICHADIQPGAGAACQECDGRLHHMCSFTVCGVDIIYGEGIVSKC